MSESPPPDPTPGAGDPDEGSMLDEIVAGRRAKIVQLRTESEAWRELAVSTDHDDVAVAT
jgi:hypothetical protein